MLHLHIYLVIIKLVFLVYPSLITMLTAPKAGCPAVCFPSSRLKNCTWASKWTINLKGRHIILLPWHTHKISQMWLGVPDNCRSFLIFGCVNLASLVFHRSKSIGCIGHNPVAIIFTISVHDFVATIVNRRFIFMFGAFQNQKVQVLHQFSSFFSFRSTTRKFQQLKQGPVSLPKRNGSLVVGQQTPPKLPEGIPPQSGMVSVYNEKRYVNMEVRHIRFDYIWFISYKLAVLCVL